MPYAFTATSAELQIVTNERNDSGNNNTSDDDRYFRRMMKWVVIALIATIALAIVVVEFTLRLLNR